MPTRIREKTAKTKRRAREPDGKPVQLPGGVWRQDVVDGDPCRVWALTPAGMLFEQYRQAACQAVGVEWSTPDESLIDRLCLLAYTRPAQVPVDALAYLGHVKAQEYAAERRPSRPEQVRRLVAQLKAIDPRIPTAAAIKIAASSIGVRWSTAHDYVYARRRRSKGSR